MIQICPNPGPWNNVFQKLKHYAQKNKCDPSEPPIPLILSGWIFSDDFQKKDRWEETVRWATDNGCVEIVSSLPETDFLVEETLSSFAGYGPAYEWKHFEPKELPTPEVLDESLDVLSKSWPKIAGEELSAVTRPIAFAGKKRRRLMVHVKPGSEYQPPWGTWDQLSQDKSKRQMFTELRTSVNKAIVPHEVDHIDFTIRLGQQSWYRREGK